MFAHKRIFLMAERRELPPENLGRDGFPSYADITGMQDGLGALIGGLALGSLILGSLYWIEDEGGRFLAGGIGWIFLIGGLVWGGVFYLDERKAFRRLERHLERSGELIGITAAALPTTPQHVRQALAIRRMREFAERTARTQADLGVEHAQSILAKQELNDAYDLLRKAGWVPEGGYEQYFPKG